MGHVGEKLRLVLRCQGELSCPFFDLLSRLFDLVVLDFDVMILAGEESCLFFELGVGTLKLLLPSLQFFGTCLQLAGEALRLVQQRVGSRVGDDGVDVDADCFHQLVQKVPVHLRERGEGGELKNAEDVVFKENRQYDKADGRGLAEAGGNPHIVGGRLLDHDRFFRPGRLSDQGLSDVELSRHIGVGLVAVAGDQLQGGAVWTGSGQEKCAVLRADQWSQLVHDQMGDRSEIAASLHQAGDAGQVGLQPVLLLIGPGGLT